MPAEGPPAAADGGGELLALLDEVRTIALNGLRFTDSPYDRERYERLLDVVVGAYGTALDAPADAVRARLLGELGYVTPKVGADAAAFDDEGRLLVIRRADDGRWSLPGGWVAPGEAPEDAACREAREETGLEVAPRGLAGVFATPAGGRRPHAMVALVYLCDVVGGEARCSHESTAVTFRHPGDVGPWHGRHGEYAAAARRVWAERGGGHG